MAVSKQWKAENYNRNIRVSNQTIDQLRAGKTFANNVANFKKTGMTAQEREAMNRFYGKARVSSALGNGGSSAGHTNITAQSVASNPVHVRSHRAAGARVADWASTTYKPAPVVKNTTTYRPPTNTSKNSTKKTNKSFWSKAGGFVTNELLGFDDFKRTANYVSKGQWGKAGKSAFTGVAEFGSTAASLVFTGGAGIGVRAAASGAKFAAKAGAKTAAKTVVKKTARDALRKQVGADLKTAAKTIAKAPLSTAFTGSLKAGTLGALKTGRYVAGTGKYVVGQTARRTVSAVGKGASKVSPALTSKAANVVPTRLAAKNATLAYNKANKALTALKTSGASKKEIAAAKAAKDAAAARSRSTWSAYNKAVKTGKAARVGKGGRRAKAVVLTTQAVNSRVKK